MVLRSVIAFVALVSPTHSLSWSNPLIPSDAPDPGCMYDPLSSLYHCVHTCNGAGAKCTNPQGNFPIYTSPTLSNFTYAGVAMPSEGNKGWGEDRFWAPEIHLTSPGSYRLVYTAGNKDGDLCIGLAASESPLGPYADVSDSPLLCNSDADEVVKGVGLIDGHVVVSDTGACTLFYKVDGNADGTGGTKDVIRKVNLDEDCVSVVEEDVGKHEFVLRNELEWEGSCVEAPWYVQRDGYEYVFYSSSMYNTVNYNVGVARRQVGEGDGEWEKFTDGPVLKVKGEDENPGFSGPGHCSVIKEEGDEVRYFMIYHAHIGYSTPTVDTERVMMMDEVLWDEEGWPTVGDGGVPSESEVTV